MRNHELKYYLVEPEIILIHKHIGNEWSDQFPVTYRINQYIYNWYKDQYNKLSGKRSDWLYMNYNQYCVLYLDKVKTRISFKEEDINYCLTKLRERQIFI